MVGGCLGLKLCNKKKKYLRDNFLTFTVLDLVSCFCGVDSRLRGTKGESMGVQLMAAL